MSDSDPAWYEKFTDRAADAASESMLQGLGCACIGTIIAAIAPRLFEGFAVAAITYASAALIVLGLFLTAFGAIVAIYRREVRDNGTPRQSSQVSNASAPAPASTPPSRIGYQPQSSSGIPLPTPTPAPSAVLLNPIEPTSLNNSHGDASN
jgi:hypothetical protein